MINIYFQINYNFFEFFSLLFYKLIKYYCLFIIIFISKLIKILNEIKYKIY